MHDNLFYNLILGTLFGIIIAAVSFRLKFLTLSGAAASAVLAIIIYGFGGWQWTLPVLLFFVLSSILSKNKIRKK